MTNKPACAVLLALCFAACGKPGKTSYGQSGTQASFDLDMDPARVGFFFDLPWPSDLRLKPDGRPELGAFRNPRGLPVVDTFLKLAGERKGYPVVPVAYFHFSAALAARDGAQEVPPGPEAPVLLFDVVLSANHAMRHDLSVTVASVAISVVMIRTGIAS